MYNLQGHFRRGAALEALGRWRESVIAYLLCLHLGGTNHTVVKSVYKVRGGRGQINHVTV